MQRALTLEAPLPHSTSRPLDPLHAVLWGALVTAAFDGPEATTLRGLRAGAAARARPARWALAPQTGRGGAWPRRAPSGAPGRGAWAEPRSPAASRRRRSE